MKKRFSLLACSALLLLCACGGGSGNMDKLNGKWSADAAETAKASGVKPQNEFEKNMLELIYSAVGMEIDASGKKITMGFGPTAKGGPFSIVSDSGNEVVLQEGSNKFTIVFVNDDLVIMRDENEPEKPIAFRRVK